MNLPDRTLEDSEFDIEVVYSRFFCVCVCVLHWTPSERTNIVQTNYSRNPSPSHFLQRLLTIHSIWWYKKSIPNNYITRQKRTCIVLVSSSKRCSMIGAKPTVVLWDTGTGLEPNETVLNLTGARTNLTAPGRLSEMPVCCTHRDEVLHRTWKKKKHRTRVRTSYAVELTWGTDNIITANIAGIGALNLNSCTDYGDKQCHQI